MNAIFVSVVLLALVCVVTFGLRSHRARWGQRRIRPRGGQFLHRREREVAILQSQDLARAIMDGRTDPVAHLVAGVVLQPDEEAWTQARARLTVRVGEATSTTQAEVSWLGRHVRNAPHEITGEQWYDHGQIDWLITSKRLVGRLPATGEMVSVSWPELAGLDIMLKHGRIVLNGINGWTGILTGAAVAPIAVAAVAKCHGTEALRVHPALRHIWPPRFIQPPPREPPPIQAGASIIRLPVRKTPS